MLLKVLALAKKHLIAVQFARMVVRLKQMALRLVPVMKHLIAPQSAHTVARLRLTEHKTALAILPQSVQVH